MDRGSVTLRPDAGAPRNDSFNTSGRDGNDGQRSSPGWCFELCTSITRRGGRPPTSYEVARPHHGRRCTRVEPRVNAMRIERIKAAAQDVVAASLVGDGW